MSDLPQDWGFLGSTSRGRPAGDSGSKEEEIPFIDNAEPAHWTQTCTAPEPSGFSDIFQILSDIHLQEPSPPPAAKAVDTLRNNLGDTEHVEPGNSTRKRKVHDLELRKCPSEGNEQLSSEAKRKEGQKPKRTRSAETHNMSERRRRDRIKEKIRSLHQLIPNSDKKDCASILDEAVGYMKTLKVQAQMMSMIMGTVYYNPYMSATGIQNMPVDQYSPYVPFRPGLRLVPLVPIPSPPKSSPGLRPLVQGPMELDPSLPIPGTGGLPAMRPTNTAMPPPHLDSKGKGPAFKELEMANSGSQEASTSGQISSNFNPGSIVHATHIVPPATKGHHTNM